MYVWKNFFAIMVQIRLELNCLSKKQLKRQLDPMKVQMDAPQHFEKTLRVFANMLIFLLLCALGTKIFKSEILEILLEKSSICHNNRVNSGIIIYSMTVNNYTTDQLEP